MSFRNLGLRKCAHAEWNMFLLFMKRLERDILLTVGIEKL